MTSKVFHGVGMRPIYIRVQCIHYGAVYDFRITTIFIIRIALLACMMCTQRKGNCHV